MTHTQTDIYPKYTTPERLADGTMHVLGILSFSIASVYLIALVAPISTTIEMASVLIYCFSVLFSFVASALYHFTPWEALRPAFRKYDHAAIFLKIAGTYTPLVVLIGGHFSYFILGFVWAIALGGMIWKIAFWSEPGWGSTLLYLVLGWASLALVWPLVHTMPWASTALIGAGGIIYTLGVIFYKWEDLRFSVAIWHGFVIAASACIYAAIYLGEYMKLG